VKFVAKFINDKLEFNDVKGPVKILRLPKLSEEEKAIIDPIVAPTSGLRIQLYDIIEDDKKYFLSNRKLFLFLRVFKAISQQFIELKGPQNLKVLIVTDNRPSRKLLLKYCSEIFAYDGFEVFHQLDSPEESKVSSPFGAASVALYKELELVIVLTASHNDISWNGIKFYIDYPIPMSGKFFKEISQKALDYTEIHLEADYKPILTNAIERNNEYIKKLLSKVLEIRSIKDRNIVIWPYLGKAKGIVDLFKYYGANVILIEEEINPPNPIKVIREEKLREVMERSDSKIALLLDADRDRIALYVKQNGEYFTYIPNEIYSAMHNILAKEYRKKIINVRTIPSDLRGDHTSFINILTGVGYKHLGVILYFLLGINVEPSKISKAILYYEDENKNLTKINKASPLRQHIINLIENQHLESDSFLMVFWEESGGHTLNILDISKNKNSNDYTFTTDHEIIADKYPVPALVLITELLCRGYLISESIDWSIKGINRTIHATDKEKVKIIKNFEKNDGKSITIKEKKYVVNALSDNNGMIDIFELKSENSTLYFRPSGTGPNIRFYIFGKKETHLKEILTVMEFVNQNYK
jgi:phosphomannomutase